MTTIALPPTLADLPTRHVRRKHLDPRAYVLRHAAAGDCGEVVEPPLVVVEHGRITIVYLDLRHYGVDLEAQRAALAGFRYTSHERTQGMTSVSRTFGFAPRNPIRADFCTSAALAHEDPEGHALICETAATCEHFYRLTNPVLYRQHAELIAHNVIAPYRLANGVFTSGIINDNNQLPYHFDRGNFESVWSAMLVWKQGIAPDSGHLAVPQYDLAFSLPDHSLLMFDGQGLLHGVTPIVKQTPTARRFSVVYYSLAQMWKCETPAAELARIRRVKTHRERKRADE